MHVASTFDGLQAISLIDDNAQDFSEFALDLVLPRDISELEPGNEEGVYLEKFIPDGDPDDMPPYKGVMGIFCQQKISRRSDCAGAESAEELSY